MENQSRSLSRPLRARVHLLLARDTCSHCPMSAVLVLSAEGCRVVFLLELYFRFPSFDQHLLLVLVLNSRSCEWWAGWGAQQLEPVPPWYGAVSRVVTATAPVDGLVSIRIGMSEV